MKKYVYVLSHIADNNSWIEVFSNEKSAKNKLKRLVKEYKNEGQILDNVKNHYFNDNGIEMLIIKEELYD